MSKKAKCAGSLRQTTPSGQKSSADFQWLPPIARQQSETLLANPRRAVRRSKEKEAVSFQLRQFGFNFPHLENVKLLWVIAHRPGIERALMSDRNDNENDYWDA